MPTSARSPVSVVVFSGGRGSQVFSDELIRDPSVALTLAINGYDDGASTGEVRRVLGDSLGPSDFRKNASRLARALGTCPPSHVDLLDLRLPTPCDAAEVTRLAHDLRRNPDRLSPFGGPLLALETDFAHCVARLIEGFSASVAPEEHFGWADCSLGNLVFAGSYLEAGRRFSSAVADYCALLGVPEGMIEDVTCGEDAHLVALDDEGSFLASEGEIVDSRHPRRIAEIFLIDRPPTVAEIQALDGAGPAAVRVFCEQRRCIPAVNPRLVQRLAAADLIIYAPGTQNSSLFPTYMIPGIGVAIAENLRATKLLITNLKEDAETQDSSAVDLIEGAIFYLREKNRHSHPIPCLITHYMVNDPERIDEETPYIPLGRLESLEDPRLVRIGHYEDGESGRHNARALLTPFIATIVRHRTPLRIAVLFLGTSSLDRINQSIFEMLRAGIEDQRLSMGLYYWSADEFVSPFSSALPYRLRRLGPDPDRASSGLADALEEDEPDYVILFDSAGMYRGEDIANLAALLANRRLDAVWGSRRLSIRDIHHSYRRRYRGRRLMGAISYLGSHLLSLAYLLLYGRYVSDTLSGVRALRAEYLRRSSVDLSDVCANHRLLSLVLRNQGALFESPVQFFPVYPTDVEPTGIRAGLKALWTILWSRFVRVPPVSPQD